MKITTTASCVCCEVRTAAITFEDWWQGALRNYPLCWDCLGGLLFQMEHPGPDTGE